MKSSVLGALTLAAIVVTPASFYAHGAVAQGAIGGAAEGARQGARDAGPVGLWSTTNRCWSAFFHVLYCALGRNGGARRGL